MCDFSFPGESHDFWEFLCVDKGEVNVLAGEKFHALKNIVLFENIIIQKCKKGKEEIGIFGGGFGQNIKIGKDRSLSVSLPSWLRTEENLTISFSYFYLLFVQNWTLL